MTKFLQTLMDGLAVGSLYALIALGYTMVYGILKFINFAHSDVFVLGAWISLVAALGAGWTGSGAPAELPEWLWNLLRLLPAAAVLFVVYERLLIDRWGGRIPLRLPRTRLGDILCVVTVAVWLAWLFMLAARFFKAQPGGEIFSGLLILLCAMATCGGVGFTVERLAYKPLRGSPRLNVLITAIGVSLLLQNTGQLPSFFGTQPRRMPELLQDRVLMEIGGSVVNGVRENAVNLRLVDVVGAGTAVLLMLVLEWLVFRTKLGQAMRAVSFNTNTAALMGISVDRVISFTFVLGSMLAAAAGFLYAMKYPGLNQPAHATWVLLGLKAFVAAVIGGIGNVRGAMLGGVFIGLIEFFGASYLSAAYKDVYVFSLLILVLLLRPTGILGKAAVEKV